ncbi:MAG: hypothetical protein F6K28_46055 [Microcoleus sp. SIO2G3]|nr:hypothetical protein [Microcoleus sp. SIO2G3]
MHSLIGYPNPRYRDCKKYRPQPKPDKRNHWGSQLLAGFQINKGKPKKTSPEQMALPWAQWETPDSQVQQVAEKFVFANCYNQQAAGVIMQQRQVSET